MTNVRTVSLTEQYEALLQQQTKRYQDMVRSQKLGFTPLGDRVVIKADVEDHAPQATTSGLLTATTLAAAVDGSDTEDSWFVGTVVAVGPLVNHFDCRKFVLRRLKEIDSEYGVDLACLSGALDIVANEIKALPTDCPDPVHVGDRVTFSWSAGQQLQIDGEKFLILRARDLLAVLTPECV